MCELIAVNVVSWINNSRVFMFFPTVISFFNVASWFSSFKCYRKTSKWLRAGYLTRRKLKKANFINWLYTNNLHYNHDASCCRLCCSCWVWLLSTISISKQNCCLYTQTALIPGYLTCPWKWFMGNNPVVKWLSVQIRDVGGIHTHIHSMYKWIVFV